MIAAGTWVFAVDFGTTNTVASTADARGATTLSINNRKGQPSAVYLNEVAGEQRSWAVGDYAIRMANQGMEWFEPSPKRAIGHSTLFLGGQDVPVGEAIASVIKLFAEEASLQHEDRKSVV